uniref:Uncharacterized protein n=1 Tax=Ditylenchus dipsaci TaxID=166011 RepID=A0A915E8B5_9BILA
MYIFRRRKPLLVMVKLNPWATIDSIGDTGFFGNSPNRGIFIEQEASCSSQDFSELVISESKDNVGSETMDGKAENVKPQESFASFLTSLNEKSFWEAT